MLTVPTYQSAYLEVVAVHESSRLILCSLCLLNVNRVPNISRCKSFVETYCLASGSSNLLGNTVARRVSFVAYPDVQTSDGPDVMMRCKGATESLYTYTQKQLELQIADVVHNTRPEKSASWSYVSHKLKELTRAIANGFALLWTYREYESEAATALPTSSMPRYAQVEAFQPDAPQITAYYSGFP